MTRLISIKLCYNRTPELQYAIIGYTGDEGISIFCVVQTSGRLLTLYNIYYYNEITIIVKEQKRSVYFYLR
jgi:hypothetical protein